nr:MULTISPECIES: GNAT family N-acetyltransferase [Cellulomonas]
MHVLQPVRQSVQRKDHPQPFAGVPLRRCRFHLPEVHGCQPGLTCAACQPNLTPGGPERRDVLHLDGGSLESADVVVGCALVGTGVRWQAAAVPLTAEPVVPADRWDGSSQPTLAADGLVLRRWHREDAAAVRAAYDDDAIRRWHARTMADEDEARAWIEGKNAAWRAGTAAEWAVVAPTARVDEPAQEGSASAGGSVVGRAALTHLNLFEGYAALAYWVVPEARGRRVAVRAGTEVLRWAFEDLGLHRVEVEHSTRNPASCRVAELLGCRAEGVRRGHALHADGHHDMHLHARLRTDVPLGALTSTSATP